MRIKSLLGTAVVLSFLSYSTYPAVAEVRQGPEVLVNVDEVVDDDLYVFAQRVTVNGTIRGDLVVFGQQVNINGSVDGDLIAAGQQVSLNGQVADDVRIGAQVVTLENNVDIGDDVIVASYSLECAKASHIGGDVKFAGYQSILAGRVEKKVVLTSANCELSGSFGDNVDAVVEGRYGPAGMIGSDFPTIPEGLTITESANIAGNLNYHSTREATINPESTIAGEIEHSQIESDGAQPRTLKDQAIAIAKQFFAVLLVGLLVVFICPTWTGQVVSNIQRRPIASLGWGILTLIGIIFGVVLLLVATIAVAVLLGYVSLFNLIPASLWLGGLSTTVLIVGFWLFSVWVTKVIVSVWAGNRIINGPTWASRQRFLALALGILIFVALSNVPIAGSIIGLVVTLMGVGSTAIWLFSEPDSKLLVSEKPKP